MICSLQNFALEIGDTDRAIPKNVPKGSKETPSGEKDDNERAMATATAKKKMRRRANVNGCAKTIDLSQETLLGYTLYLFNIPLTTFPIVVQWYVKK